MTTANLSHTTPIYRGEAAGRQNFKNAQDAQTVSQSKFLSDVLTGLASSPKTLPCKYLYDAHGSKLFDQICELPEYYPTRTEIGILRRHLPEMAELLGPKAQVVEYGSGSGLKTRLLLDALHSPTGCALIEISCSHLENCARKMQGEFSHLEISAVCADYTRPVKLPEAPDGTARKIVFFPGSTIGNFDSEDAQSFLKAMAETVGTGGGLLIGVDLRKDRAILEPAYDDAAGVTAEFNLNLLQRINRELGANFPLKDFEHKAIYNSKLGRVEMHLVSKSNQVVRIAGKAFEFKVGETIHTENSYKYTIAGFKRMATSAGWNVEQVWTDDDNLFSVQYLTT